MSLSERWHRTHPNWCKLIDDVWQALRNICLGAFSARSHGIIWYRWSTPITIRRWSSPPRNVHHHYHRLWWVLLPLVPVKKIQYHDSVMSKLWLTAVWHILGNPQRDASQKKINKRELKILMAHRSIGLRCLSVWWIQLCVCREDVLS